MRTRLLLPLLLAPLLLVACTPGRAADDPGGVVAGATPEEAAAAPTPSVIRQAEAIIGPRFGSNTGWIESIVRMEYGDDFILKVTLDRATFTLSQLDAYTQMCRALSAMIATEEKPDGILAVQFFKADGTPMVGTASADSNCRRF